MSSINIYSSPLCSCSFCRKLYSAKSIHSHFIRKHTNLSVRNSGKGTSKFQLRCSCVSCHSEVSVQNLSGHHKKCESPKLFCKYCGAIITTRNQFCSHSCSAKYTNEKKGYKKKTVKIQKPKQDVYPYTKVSQCSNCNKWFLGSRSTCSTTCLHQRYVTIGKLNSTKRMKRSKDEIKLFELCNSHFSTVTHNEPIFNGWDADILIYDLKIAILWNGPWHYQEMNFGTHSLIQVKNRDQIKIKEIEKSGWSYLIFEDRFYSPESAFEDIKLRSLESNQVLRIMSPT